MSLSLSVSLTNEYTIFPVVVFTNHVAKKPWLRPWMPLYARVWTEGVAATEAARFTSGARTTIRAAIVKPVSNACKFCKSICFRM